MTTEDFKRKLTAILSADVAGYSKLMGDDEAATVKTLETYKGVMFSLIRQHRGRVVDSPGDNLLADFGSVVDAVQCGVSIQKELQTRNADLPENRRMQFRIGINLGDVIEEEERIYGDGVNIAARLESLADPGGICISKTAFDQIESKLPLGYESLGEQTVKNIARPVGAYKVLMETRVVDAKTKRESKAVPFWRKKSILSLGIIIILAIAVFLYWNFYPREPSIEPASIESEQVSVKLDVEEAPKTIAVLPFADLSPEKDQEYFVDGLSEEILNCLAKITGLRVTSRTSSFFFKGTKEKLQVIAKDLGVENILEGSVRKAGDKLRITAQLIRAKDDYHLWSETYDKEFKVEEMFSVQEDIATAVANELKVTLGIGKSLKLLGGTENEKAYELYLVAKGMEDLSQKVELLDEATAIDPDFALAWADKAAAHCIRAIYSTSNFVALEYDAGLSAAMNALALEPDLPTAHYSLGLITEMSRGDWIEAELEYRKGMELTTKSIDPTGYGLAVHYFSVGNFKMAQEILETARQEDPLHQRVRAQYCFILGLLGDSQRAKVEYDRCVALFGDSWISNHPILSTLFFLSTKDTAFYYDIYDTVYSDPIFDVAKKYLESAEDGLTELHKIYTDEGSLNSGDFMAIMMWTAYFGDPHFSMDAMERGVRINASGIFHIWLPIMHEVRQLPRFKEFAREIGLVDYWEQFGWPDICRPLDNGDFVCD